MSTYSHLALRVFTLAAIALAVLGLAHLACEPSPRVVTAPPPPTLGTRHPILVTAIAPDHRWVVACQARHDTDGNRRIWVPLEHSTRGAVWVGDELRPYLFLDGIGEGMAIDGVVTASADGRWVVVVRDRALIAIDTVRGSELRIHTGRTVQNLAIRGNGPWVAVWSAAFDDPDRPISYINPSWSLHAGCQTIFMEPEVAPGLRDGWLNLETGERRTTPGWQPPATPADPLLGLRASQHLDHADIGVDNHGRVLRETLPRPDPSELPWGPLRWDAL